MREGTFSLLISKTEGWVNGIREHENLLYLLCFIDKIWTVQVYSIDGEAEISSWMHEDTCGFRNRLAIHQDTVLIPSHSQRNLKTQTILEEPAGKDIDITFYGGHTSPCITTSGHAIVMPDSPSFVLCVNLNSGSQFWQVTNLNHPEGMICDKKSGHILVSTGGQSETVQVQVQVLREDTG